MNEMQVPQPEQVAAAPQPSRPAGVCGGSLIAVGPRCSMAGEARLPRRWGAAVG